MSSFNHHNIWYPGPTNTVTYEHPEHADTDIVKCTYNEWLHILNQERHHLQQLIDQNPTYYQTVNGHHKVSIAEAQESILRHYPHLNIAALDKICNKPFVKCRASDSNVTPVNIMGLIYKCSSCYSGFDENYTIFMCPIHSNYILCSLCHGYHAEMQIYKILKNRMISMDPKCFKDSELVRLTQLSLQQDLESIESSAIEHCNKICKYIYNINMNNYNSTFITPQSNSDDEISQIIIRFIGIRDIIKILPLPLSSLVSLFNSCWNSQIIQTTPKLDDRYYSSYPGYKCGFNAYSTTFRLHKLSMTQKEFNKFQSKPMFKKYIKHNSIDVDWNGVKSSNWIWRFYIERNNDHNSSKQVFVLNPKKNDKSKLNVGAMEFIPQTEQRRRRKEKSKSKSKSKSHSKSKATFPNKSSKETDSSGSSARLQSSPESTPKKQDRARDRKPDRDRDRDRDGVSQRLLIGDILDILCNGHRYKFHGLEIKLRDYSYVAHQYNPGGKPQIYGDGNCLIFRIGDNDNYYVISQYERK